MHILIYADTEKGYPQQKQKMKRNSSTGTASFLGCSFLCFHEVWKHDT